LGWLALLPAPLQCIGAAAMSFPNVGDRLITHVVVALDAAAGPSPSAWRR